MAVESEYMQDDNGVTLRFAGDTVFQRVVKRNGERFEDVEGKCEEYKMRNEKKMESVTIDGYEDKLNITLNGEEVCSSISKVCD